MYGIIISKLDWLVYVSLRLAWGIAVGFAAPLLRSVLLGMPVMSPCMGEDLKNNKLVLVCWPMFVQADEHHI